MPASTSPLTPALSWFHQKPLAAVAFHCPNYHGLNCVADVYPLLSPSKLELELLQENEWRGGYDYLRGSCTRSNNCVRWFLILFERKRKKEGSNGLSHFVHHFD